MSDQPDGAKQREFTITRVFDAPRELVWRAWTEPEQLAAWWGPRGMTTPVESIELDVRPGGVFNATMVAPDGTEYPSRMEYREVVEPELLAYGWGVQRDLGSGEVRVTFTEVDGKTEQVTHMVGWLTDEMAAMSKTGTQTQFDKLAEHLAQA